MPKTELHHYWTKVPNTLTLNYDQNVTSKLFVTSLSTNQTDAFKYFKLAMASNQYLFGIAYPHVTVSIR